MEKVSTLSNSTQRLIAYTRDRLECWTLHSSGSGSDDDATECELMCRMGGGAWITARQTPQPARQTLVAFETPVMSSLQEAAAHAHKCYDAVGRGCYAGLG